MTLVGSDLHSRNQQAAVLDTTRRRSTSALLLLIALFGVGFAHRWLQRS